MARGIRIIRSRMVIERNSKGGEGEEGGGRRDNLMRIRERSEALRVERMVTWRTIHALQGVYHTHVIENNFRQMPS